MTRVRSFADERVSLEADDASPEHFVRCLQDDDGIRLKGVLLSHM